jgi:hypothetical protein
VAWEAVGMAAPRISPVPTGDHGAVTVPPLLTTR